MCIETGGLIIESFCDFLYQSLLFTNLLLTVLHQRDFGERKRFIIGVDIFILFFTGSFGRIRHSWFKYLKKENQSAII